MLDLTSAQIAIIRFPLNSKIFLSGPASCGKTTVGVARLDHLLQSGIPGDSILILTPQRTLQEPYLDLLKSPMRLAGGEFTPATLGGLARRMCDLFWPLAAEPAGFADPNQPPIFLTLETAQYFMARLARPLIKEQGYFESITIDRNRLYSQVLDNLNKSAAVGFPFTQIAERLGIAWSGEPAQRRIYANAQECASLFRQYCLDHNLLDFSLQLEIFLEFLWPQQLVRDTIIHSYQHLIYDNVEEDIPRAHDFIRELLPDLASALIIHDEDGGYRRFLGADTSSALSLKDSCTEEMTLDQSFVVSANISRLAGSLAGVIDPNFGQRSSPIVPITDSLEKKQPAYSFIFSRYYPELLDTIVARVQTLITEEKVPPQEIVILFPYLSDALRFSLMNRLEAAAIPVRSHRPSRSLRTEPASHCLLTLSAIAHPDWSVIPTLFDVAYALMLALDMDLVRARLLAEIVYHPRGVQLTGFGQIKTTMQERITYALGARYSILHEWLLNYRAGAPLPLDHFLRKLFGEVLSQSGFGFHQEFDLARVAASLIESVQKFRQAMQPMLGQVHNLGSDATSSTINVEIGREFNEMLNDGVIAAQYLEGWQVEANPAVLVAPAHTFLMMNTPVSVQFWLDAGSSGWTERLSQPLTHPYVLSREWEQFHTTRIWSDTDEVAAENDALARLVVGLLRRCRSHIYLGMAELGESGFESRGGLLRAFQRIILKEGCT